MPIRVNPIPRPLPKTFHEASGLRSPRDSDSFLTQWKKNSGINEQLAWLTESVRRVQEQINRLRLHRGDDEVLGGAISGLQLWEFTGWNGDNTIDCAPSDDGPSIIVALQPELRSNIIQQTIEGEEWTYDSYSGQHRWAYYGEVSEEQVITPRFVAGDLVPVWACANLWMDIDVATVEIDADNGGTDVGRGTGYTVGDVLTIAGGLISMPEGTVYQETAATIRVTEINGGGGTGPVKTIVLESGGDYLTAPESPNTPTGGTGSGLIVRLTTSSSDVGYIAITGREWGKIYEAPA